MTYLACVSVHGENKISTFRIDPETGALQNRTEVPLDAAPGSLVFGPERSVLYAVIRQPHLQILSLRIDPDGGGFSPVGTVSLEANPCYVTLDQTRRFLFSAYYFDGLVAVHPIDENGAAGGPPVEWRSTAVKAHCFRTDPSNRYAFVPHTGESNFIAQFKFDGETGALTPNDPPRVEADEGAGPRHFLFHPDKDVVYFSNEQGGSVTAYRFDPSAGTLAAFQTVSTLPEGFTEHNHCAQINITPSGRFLYVSNRGHDSIACFAIDGDTGELTALGQQPTEQRPRAFTVDPTGNFLLAAGQESGRLASYRIDAETGKLEPLKIYDIGDNPAWVLALALPE